FGLLGQENHSRVGVKFRIDVHGQSNHAEVIVEEFFAGGVIGRVAGNAGWFTDFGQNFVGFAQCVTGDVSESVRVFISTNALFHFSKVQSGQFIGPRAVVQ